MSRPGEEPKAIGPYRIAGRMGAGGMGVVYEGIAADGSRAAVKVIHPGLAADPHFLARFIREVDLLSRVRGRCTVSVLASDTAATPPWLATTFVTGPTLSRYVAENGPLRPEELVSFGVDIAEALTDIHRAGIVHRDLKPGNVILTGSGAKVLDFGIARALDESGLTGTGALIGSPGWISPEQYRGDQANAAADVFAWGALMAYASTGRPPFGTGAPDVLAYRVMSVEPDLSGVPAPVRDVVLDALAKDRAARPTAYALLARLTGPRSGTEILPSPPSPPDTKILPPPAPQSGTTTLPPLPSRSGTTTLPPSARGKGLAAPLWASAVVAVAAAGAVFAMSSAGTPETLPSMDDPPTSTYTESLESDTSDTPAEPFDEPSDEPSDEATPDDETPTPRKTKSATAIPCASASSIIRQAAALNGGSLPDDVVVTGRRCVGNWVAARLGSQSVGGIDLIAKRNATRFVAAHLGSDFCSLGNRPALLASAPGSIKTFLCPNGFS